MNVDILILLQQNQDSFSPISDVAAPLIVSLIGGTVVVYFGWIRDRQFRRQKLRNSLDSELVNVLDPASQNLIPSEIESNSSKELTNSQVEDCLNDIKYGYSSDMIHGPGFEAQLGDIGILTKSEVNYFTAYNMWGKKLTSHLDTIQQEQLDSLEGERKREILKNIEQTREYYVRWVNKCIKEFNTKYSNQPIKAKEDMITILLILSLMALTVIWFIIYAYFMS